MTFGLPPKSFGTLNVVQVYDEERLPHLITNNISDFNAIPINADNTIGVVTNVTDSKNLVTFLTFTFASPISINVKEYDQVAFSGGNYSPFTSFIRNVERNKIDIQIPFEGPDGGTVFLREFLIGSNIRATDLELGDYVNVANNDTSAFGSKRISRFVNITEFAVAGPILVGTIVPPTATYSRCLAINTVYEIKNSMTSNERFQTPYRFQTEIRSDNPAANHILTLGGGTPTEPVFEIFSPFKMSNIHISSAFGTSDLFSINPDGISFSGNAFDGDTKVVIKNCLINRTLTDLSFGNVRKVDFEFKNNICEQVTGGFTITDCVTKIVGNDFSFVNTDVTLFSYNNSDIATFFLPIESIIQNNSVNFLATGSFLFINLRQPKDFPFIISSNTIRGGTATLFQEFPSTNILGSNESFVNNITGTITAIAVNTPATGETQFTFSVDHEQVTDTLVLLKSSTGYDSYQGVYTVKGVIDTTNFFVDSPSEFGTGSSSVNSWIAANTEISFSSPHGFTNGQFVRIRDSVYSGVFPVIVVTTTEILIPGETQVTDTRRPIAILEDSLRELDPQISVFNNFNFPNSSCGGLVSQFLNNTINFNVSNVDVHVNSSATEFSSGQANNLFFARDHKNPELQYIGERPLNNVEIIFYAALASPQTRDFDIFMLKNGTDIRESNGAEHTVETGDHGVITFQTITSLKKSDRITVIFDAKDPNEITPELISSALTIKPLDI